MSHLYRADHVGSLLRPAESFGARRLHSPLGQLRAIEDRHILRVLQCQKEIGFELFTGGELCRTNLMGDFTDAVEGFNFADAVPSKWEDEAPKLQQATPQV